MRNIITILKKELKRFFTDKRMLMSLFMPGILIFVLYSIMGSFMSDLDSVEDDYIFKAVVVNYDNNMDDYFLPINNNTIGKFEFEYTEKDTNLDSYKELLKNEELDLLIVYPDNFYNESKNYDPNIQGNNNSPIINIYYNSSRKESMNLYNIYSSLLNSFQEEIAEKFRVNASNDIYDFASEESTTILIITSLVPFLLITFLFTGAMSVSIESIAGEKERGTIATLLSTPLKRNELALGKISGLSIVALTSAASSFLGLMLSLPKLMQGIDLDLSIYGFGHYLLLFFAIVTTTLVYVVLISLVSAFSKSVKEATSLAGVVMILNMLVGITSLGGVTSKKIGYFIPIYNSVKAITDILSLNISTTYLLITGLINLGIVAIGSYILTLMFNSEKVMFNK